MGIKGLKKFVEDNHLSKDHKLHDSKVVIDGNNLNHHIYAEHNKSSSKFGGDYYRYAAGLKQYFNSLKKCKIEPIVVIDGGLDRSDRFSRTQEERYKRKLKCIEQLSSEGDSQDVIFPVFLVQVFLDVLSELKIRFVQCEYDSDTQIAALANHYECPLLSDDNDFYMHLVKKGFIRLSSLEEGEVISSGYLYKKCVIYYVDNILTRFRIERNVLPLLASLIGNDYLKDDDLECFNNIMKIFYKGRIYKIIKWLSTVGFDKAKKVFLQCTKETTTRTKLEELLNFSMNTYIETDTHLMGLIDSEKYDVEEIINKSKLSLPCGKRYPNDFVKKYYKGEIPSFFLNVINLHAHFTPPLIEDYSKRSCLHTYGFIRQIIYGVLFQHEFSDENRHTNFCLSQVKEFSRSEGLNYRELFVESSVKPTLLFSSKEPVPKLNDIKNIDKNILRNYIVNLMGVSESFFSTIPSHFQLLFGSINFCVTNSDPKLTDEFISAITLSLIFFNLFRLSNLVGNTENVNGRMQEAIDQISPENAEQVKKTRDEYLRVPEINFSNQFNVSIVHSYSQIQACLSHFIFLNHLFDSPFVTPAVSEIFEGSLLYSLTRDLLKSQDSSILVERLLCQNEHFIELFKILKNTILEGTKYFQNINKKDKIRPRDEADEGFPNKKIRR